MIKRSIGKAILLLIILMSNQAFAEDMTGAETTRSRAIKEGWPDTQVGFVAFGWIEAFNTGEEAMKKYLGDNLTRKSLAERSMAVRMISYRSLVEKFGYLMFTKIVESKPSELTATVMAEDTTMHRFIFKVNGRKTHSLEMVGIVQSGH